MQQSALLLKAVNKGYQGLVEALLTAPRHPARVAAQENAALRRAVQRRDRPMCKLLVEHGADEDLVPEHLAANDYGEESSHSDDYYRY